MIPYRSLEILKELKEKDIRSIPSDDLGKFKKELSDAGGDNKELDVFEGHSAIVEELARRDKPVKTKPTDNFYGDK